MTSYATYLYDLLSDAQGRLQHIISCDETGLLVHARMGLSRLHLAASNHTVFHSRRGRRIVRNAMLYSRFCVLNQLVLTTEPLSEWNRQELTFVSKLLKRASVVWWWRHRYVRGSSFQEVTAA